MPIMYSATAPEIAIPELDGKTGRGVQVDLKLASYRSVKPQLCPNTALTVHLRLAYATQRWKDLSDRSLQTTLGKKCPQV